MYVWNTSTLVPSEQPHLIQQPNIVAYYGDYEDPASLCKHYERPFLTRATPLLFLVRRYRYGACQRWRPS